MRGFLTGHQVGGYLGDPIVTGFLWACVRIHMPPYFSFAVYVHAVRVEYCFPAEYGGSLADIKALPRPVEVPGAQRLSHPPQVC